MASLIRLCLKSHVDQAPILGTCPPRYPGTFFLKILFVYTQSLSIPCRHIQLSQPEYPNLQGFIIDLFLPEASNRFVEGKRFGSLTGADPRRQKLTITIKYHIFIGMKIGGIFQNFPSNLPTNRPHPGLGAYILAVKTWRPAYHHRPSPSSFNDPSPAQSPRIPAVLFTAQLLALTAEYRCCATKKVPALAT